MKRYNHRNKNPKTVVGTRTCFVCKTIAPREQMLRFVGRRGQVVQFDAKEVLPGRGMWLHADRACLEKAIENNPKRADIILSYARCLNNIGENLAAAQVLAVLRDSTNSYAIKKAAEQEYQRIMKQNSIISENSIEKPLEEPTISENN